MTNWQEQLKNTYKPIGFWKRIYLWFFPTKTFWDIGDGSDKTVETKVKFANGKAYIMSIKQYD